MGFQKLPFSFDQLKKDPFVALTFLLLSYVGWDTFIHKDERLVYCKEENVRLRDERDKAIDDKDDLYKAMLYYRGISIVQGSEMERLDSIVTKKIGTAIRKPVK